MALAALLLCLRWLVAKHRFPVLTRAPVRAFEVDDHLRPSFDGASTALSIRASPNAWRWPGNSTTSDSTSCPPRVYPSANSVTPKARAFRGGLVFRPTALHPPAPGPWSRSERALRPSLASPEKQECRRPRRTRSPQQADGTRARVCSFQARRTPPQAVARAVATCTQDGGILQQPPESSSGAPLGLGQANHETLGLFAIRGEPLEAVLMQSRCRITLRCRPPVAPPVRPACSAPLSQLRGSRLPYFRPDANLASNMLRRPHPGGAYACEPVTSPMPPPCVQIAIPFRMSGLN